MATYDLVEMKHPTKGTLMVRPGTEADYLPKKAKSKKPADKSASKKKPAKPDTKKPAEKK